MNIHLPAILGFTRYQGFDPSPNILCDTNIWQKRVEKKRRLNTEASGGEMRSLMPLQARLRGAQGWHGWKPGTQPADLT